jgi:hypothetical protein
MDLSGAASTGIAEPHGRKWWPARCGWEASRLAVRQQRPMRRRIPQAGCPPGAPDGDRGELSTLSTEACVRLQRGVTSAQRGLDEMTGRKGSRGAQWARLTTAPRGTTKTTPSIDGRTADLYTSPSLRAPFDGRWSELSLLRAVEDMLRR